ncbi:uncharacterized protein BX664DRAFT_387883 [Halteromyces radiatus]|uniref:uncharacterized protein n=1 Tax=Halteromyces radiatus TaxID=101107 RepID=UPI002220F363|nr:uncharacterized protein BX664DRAFT_387883 [Halteromyces radiatus]KAI8082730.1 hypothetical protein BX664DRAFT_387883 [Halteromyces radiatus]
MALFMEYDESYVAGSKASSISSTDSGDHPPSLYTGQADSCSSLCDPDELSEPLVFDDPSPYEPMKSRQRTSISIPFEEDLIPSSSFYNTFSSSSLIIPVTNKDKQEENEQEKQQSSSISPSSHHVLSQDEKRANHIASEQKRRQNIRHGFQQLTDLIPSLKNMPHSKSTILFKTADYIRYSEKRNKVLQDRLKQLQRRVALSTTALSSATPYYRRSSALSSVSSTLSPSLLSSSSSSTTALSASSTSLALKSSTSRRASSSYTSTQLQIRRLQQQLLQQQELLLQHNIPHHSLLSPSSQQQSYECPAAIVMPASGEDEEENKDTTHMHDIPIKSTPCLHIPADDEFGQESMLRERLLSCGKLKFKSPII